MDMTLKAIVEDIVAAIGKEQDRGQAPQMLAEATGWSVFRAHG